MSEKKKRSFAFRFSTRFLLVLATLFSILFGLWVFYIQPIDRQWRAAEALLEDENLGFQITKTEPVKLPSWMLSVLKEGRRQNIVAASCSSPAKTLSFSRVWSFCDLFHWAALPFFRSSKGEAQASGSPQVQRQSLRIR